MDLTIEPWLKGFWPALKETLKISANNLSESMSQLNLSQGVKPNLHRELSTSNKFKSTEESITYSSHLAELTELTLPPKPTQSLSIKLNEPSEVSHESSTGLPYHVSTLIRRECLTHDAAVKPVMSIELQLSVCFNSKIN